MSKKIEPSYEYNIDEAVKDLTWLSDNVFDIEPPEPEYHVIDYLGILEEIRDLTEKTKVCKNQQTQSKPSSCYDCAWYDKDFGGDIICAKWVCDDHIPGGIVPDWCPLEDEDA